MVADCLTKRMGPDILLKLMRAGRLDLKPTVQSQLLKLKKQKQRASKKSTAKAKAEAKAPHQSTVSG